MCGAVEVRAVLVVADERSWAPRRKCNVIMVGFRVCVRSALGFVSGHGFSRAEKASRTRALAPAALFPSQFGFGSASGGLKHATSMYSFAPVALMAHLITSNHLRGE